MEKIQQYPMKAVRAIEIALGVVFVFAAATKALDLNAFAVQIRYYGVIQDPALIRMTAMGMTGLEAILGWAMLTGMRLRGWLYGASSGLLIVFSLLVLYAWVFRGLKDCGCFGRVLPLGPGATLVKNAAMLIAFAWMWRRMCMQGWAETAASRAAEAVKTTLGLGALASVTACLLFSGNAAFFHPPVIAQDRPFAGTIVQSHSGLKDLGEGIHFVAMMSATCDDCMAATPIINELSAIPGMPPVVGLILGNEADIETYRAKTMPIFPVQPFDSLTFFNLIGKEPPRFHIVKDGQSLRHLDTLTPTLEQLKTFALQESAP